MFPNIDNVKGTEAVKLALQNRPSQKPSTECIIEGLRICLYNNNSKFDQDNLLQTNDTATGASNSCSYSDLAIYRLDKLIKNDQINNFHELLFFFFMEDIEMIVLQFGMVVRKELMIFIGF